MDKNAKTTRKYIKNVIKIKKTAKIKINKKQKKDIEIIEKCSKQITKKSKKDIDILNKINEFNTNGRKTIAYFIDSYYPVIDGVVSVLDNYAKFMSKFYNVVVCTPKHKKATCKMDNYFVLGANSIYLKKQGYDLGFPQLDSDFTKYISLLKIDLIHINAPFTMGSFGMELAKKRHIPSITTFHSQFKQDFYKSTNSMFLANLMANFIIKFYDKSTITLTMNHFSYEIMKGYGLKRSDVQIIPNATNLVYKDFDAEVEREVLNKYKISMNKFTMLFIGRFVKVKNIYLILDVLKELNKVNKDFQFVFMGYGPEENKMKKLVKDFNLEDRVTFTGKVLDSDDKAIIIKNSSLLFFPSVYDTDGIVKIEAACYSVPTLCLEGTGVSSGLIDNETGFIEKNDIGSLAERIDQLIKNVDLVQKTGKNAKERIYVTWDDVGERLMKIYEKLLSKKVLKNSKKLKKN